jgi:hypothetical protein
MASAGPDPVQLRIAKFNNDVLTSKPINIAYIGQYITTASVPQDTETLIDDFVKSVLSQYVYDTQNVTFDGTPVIDAAQPISDYKIRKNLIEATHRQDIQRLNQKFEEDKKKLIDRLLRNDRDYSQYEKTYDNILSRLERDLEFNRISQERFDRDKKRETELFFDAKKRRVDDLLENNTEYRKLRRDIDDDIRTADIKKNSDLTAEQNKLHFERTSGYMTVYKLFNNIFDNYINQLRTHADPLIQTKIQNMNVNNTIPKIKRNISRYISIPLVYAQVNRYSGTSPDDVQLNGKARLQVHDLTITTDHLNELIKLSFDFMSSYCMDILNLADLSYLRSPKICYSMSIIYHFLYSIFDQPTPNYPSRFHSSVHPNPSNAENNEVYQFLCSSIVEIYVQASSDNFILLELRGVGDMIDIRNGKLYEIKSSQHGCDKSNLTITQSNDYKRLLPRDSYLLGNNTRNLHNCIYKNIINREDNYVMNFEFQFGTHMKDINRTLHTPGIPRTPNEDDKYKFIRKDNNSYNIGNSAEIDDTIVNDNNVVKLAWTKGTFEHMDEIIQSLLDLRKTILNIPNINVIYHFNPKIESKAVYASYTAQGDRDTGNPNTGFYDDFAFNIETYIREGGWRLCNTWFSKFLNIDLEKQHIINQIKYIYELIFIRDNNITLFNIIKQISNTDILDILNLYDSIIKKSMNLVDKDISEDLNSIFDFFKNNVDMLFNNIDNILRILLYFETLIRQIGLLPDGYLKDKLDELTTFYNTQVLLLGVLISKLKNIYLFFDNITKLHLRLTDLATILPQLPHFNSIFEDILRKIIGTPIYLNNTDGLLDNIKSNITNPFIVTYIKEKKGILKSILDEYSDISISNNMCDVLFNIINKLELAHHLLEQLNNERSFNVSGELGECEKLLIEFKEFLCFYCYTIKLINECIELFYGSKYYTRNLIAVQYKTALENITEYQKIFAPFNTEQFNENLFTQIVARLTARMEETTLPPLLPEEEQEMDIGASASKKRKAVEQITQESADGLHKKIKEDIYTLQITYNMKIEDIRKDLDRLKQAKEDLNNPIKQSIAPEINKYIKKTEEKYTNLENLKAQIESIDKNIIKHKDMLKALNKQQKYLKYKAKYLQLQKLMKSLKL